MFSNKETLRVLSLFTTHDASNDSFWSTQKEDLLTGPILIWLRKARPIPNSSTAILSQKPTSAEIVRLFGERANLEKGEFFNNECFVNSMNGRSAPDQVQL